MQFRIAATSALFIKSLKLPSHAFSHAQVTSFITGDLQKTEQIAQLLHYLWVGPVETIIILALLWTSIGSIASLASVGTLLFLIGIQQIFASSLFKIRRQINFHRDDRIEKLSNMVSSIVAVKLYAWEDALVKKIEDIRKLESEWLQRSSLGKAISSSLYFAASNLAPLIAFAVLHANNNGGKLTPRIVFVTCLFLNLVRYVMVRIGNY
jgi:ATP-binding cassette subfamily C (CFTR/MRP) protein 4